MKDGMSEMHREKFPSCPLSVHCERLLEDLDKNSASLQDDALLFADSPQDRQILIQLQAHIPTCSTCMALLTRARSMRSQQRQYLRRLLFESEQSVPSAVVPIMQAIARERSEGRIFSNGNQSTKEIAEINSILFTKRAAQKHGSRSRRRLQNLLACVAVAAVLLVSFNLFSHMLLLHSSANTPPTAGQVSASLLHSATWSSVVITLVKDRKKIITITDAMTGKSTILASLPSSDIMTVDGVSHNGYQVLYHVYDGYKTRYYLQPSAQNVLFYRVDGKGGQALWGTDDSTVFIGTPEGVKQVDVNSGRTSLILPTLKSPDLRFYRNGSLYFVSSANGSASMGLNRVNLANDEVTPLTQKYCDLSYDFWLSPSGTVIYYRCKGQTALYTVSNDGAISQVVRTDGGRMIGYSAEGWPLLLTNVANLFKVIKLGVDAQHDQMITTDVAPGASGLTVENTAVAPYGFSLVALARYANGAGKLWYDDLVLHKNTTISMLPDAKLVSSLQVGGWSRLQVPVTAPLLG